jgi:uncharacterized protein YecE (DUF72 family)
MIYHIGCSGWSYKEWRGLFYPEDLPASGWFEKYSNAFDTVELNTTFYHLPLESTIKNWKKNAPKEFHFAAKASRLITHYKRLKDCEEALDVYYSRILGLGKKLGPILFQLPPQFARDDDRLIAFLKLLPKKLTHIFEFRNHTWWHEDVYAILRKNKIGFCAYHKFKEKTPIITTSNHFYMRFHGTAPGFAGAYNTRQLSNWGKKISEAGAKEAWIYFNNDVGGHAPQDALKLRKILTGK